MSIDQRIVDALETGGIEYDRDNYDPARTFRENGIDSLDVMSLFLAVEEGFKVKFAEAEVESVRTPADLSALLDRKLS